ncbi:hypothetical protein GGQ85_004389 [Nitrobacter vulgaris]|nr:hypothetical protein [Nitrobacter vulgaris]
MGIVTDVAIRHQKIRPDNIEVIDLGARHKLIDVDRACGFKGDILEFFFRDLEIAVGIDLIALDDVFVRDFLAGFSIDFLILDTVPYVAIDLVEADLFGLRGSRKQGYRAWREGP